MWANWKLPTHESRGQNLRKGHLRSNFGWKFRKS